MLDPGEAGKREGMQRAYDHANEAWKTAMMWAILKTARELPLLTTGDVWERVDPNVWTHEPRALGPIMHKAAKAGWIEKAEDEDNKASTRAIQHKRPLQVWRSLFISEDEDLNTHSSILGGSNAARLLACPASYLEQLRNPSQKDVTSVYAEEGTMLHSMIAGMVGGEGAVEDMITTEQAEVLMTAKQALDDLKQRFGGKFRIVGVESMLPFPGITPASFGSVDLVLANKTHVLVVDWKFGKGIPVKALYEDADLGDMVNPQLAFYAVAARARFKRSFKNKQVVVAIIQPRMPQPLDYIEVAEYELDDFQVAFQHAYLEAIGGRNARREKGEHCRFASCKATCPLWVGPVIEMSVLDPKRAALEASTKPIEATSDYGAYLSHAMRLAVLAETWADEIRKQAHVYLDDGGAIPEWKLVPKRGMRKWVDEVDATQKLFKMGAQRDHIMTQPELRSVAQVEKVFKGYGTTIPDDLWMMVSSGTTLAPSDDPRPESTHGQVAENVRKALKAL